MAFVGKTVKVRFRIGTDEGTGAPGWDIDNVSFGGPSFSSITNTPFGAITNNAGTCSDGGTDGGTTVDAGRDAGPDVRPDTGGRRRTCGRGDAPGDAPRTTVTGDAPAADAPAAMDVGATPRPRPRPPRRAVEFHRPTTAAAARCLAAPRPEARQPCWGRSGPSRWCFAADAAARTETSVSSTEGRRSSRRLSSFQRQRRCPLLVGRIPQPDAAARARSAYRDPARFRSRCDHRAPCTLPPPRTCRHLARRFGSAFGRC